MTSLVSQAFTQFLAGYQSPPFEYKGIVVSSARPKTTHAVPRTGQVAHRFLGIMAATYDRGRLRFAARFICGGHSNDAIPLREEQIDGDRCKSCQMDATPYVYRHYDAGGRLLYIGSTTRRVAREQQHQYASPWWPEVDRVDYEEFPTLTAARAAERLAINLESPPHNGKPRRQRPAEVEQ